MPYILLTHLLFVQVMKVDEYKPLHNIGFVLYNKALVVCICLKQKLLKYCTWIDRLHKINYWEGYITVPNEIMGWSRDMSGKQSE